MKVSVEHNGRPFTADLSEGIDLSIPVSVNGKLNAYHAKPVRMEPFVMGNWIGEVKQGGSVNYRDIFFNPHGNCTHTECVGHISETIYSVNRHFKQFHCVAQLISVEPLRLDNGDAVIGPEQLVGLQQTDAVIIRTLPNTVEKRNRNYSGTNPPYLLKETIEKLVVNGCKHLILDLPSIDREEDGGQLLGHKVFWNYPENPRMDCTVTELAFVPNAAKDGLYLLNLQVAPFENDAAPSRPLIFPLKAV
ncbi:MAG: cyclase family protein [Flavobacteriales bacterium]|nr:cyclase family protein [Flavobacteriales bacterium]